MNTASQRLTRNIEVVRQQTQSDVSLSSMPFGRPLAEQGLAWPGGGHKPSLLLKGRARLLPIERQLDG